MWRQGILSFALRNGTRKGLLFKGSEFSSPVYFLLFVHPCNDAFQNILLRFRSSKSRSRRQKHRNQGSGHRRPDITTKKSTFRNASGPGPHRPPDDFLLRGTRIKPIQHGHAIHFLCNHDSIISFEKEGLHPQKQGKAGENHDTIFFSNIIKKSQSAFENSTSEGVRSEHMFKQDTNSLLQALLQEEEEEDDDDEPASNYNEPQPKHSPNLLDSSSSGTAEKILNEHNEHSLQTKPETLSKEAYAPTRALTPSGIPQKNWWEPK